MHTSPIRINQVRYPAFELFYDRDREGTEGLLRRLKAVRDEPGAAFGGETRKQSRERRRVITKCAFVEQVRRRPGRHIADLVQGLDHCFPSIGAAQRSITRWMLAGEIEGVRFERVGKYLRVWPLEMQ